MKKDTQFLLALASGLKPDHKLLQNMEASSRLREAFLAAAVLTKEDVFSSADSHVSFFNEAEVWPIFPRIVAHLRKNGETITAADFQTKIDGGNSLLSYAEKLGTLKFLFAAENWENNLDEMENLWFSASDNCRKLFDFWPHYHSAAKLSNIDLRESIVSQTGESVNTVMEQILNGHAHVVDKRLKDAGHKLTKGDLFLVDTLGKSLSKDKRLWDHFDGIIQILRNNGERLCLADFERERAGNRSLFDSALQNSRISTIFTSKIWRGRMGEMMALWDKVPDDKRSGVDMTALLTDLEDHEFSHLINLDEDMSIADLVKPQIIATRDNDSTSSTTSIAPPQGEQSTKTSFEIRPLGLQAAWHNIWSLDNTSNESGLPPIGLDELRLPHGYFGQSCMFAATRYGFFEIVVDLLRAKNEWFNIDDITNKTGKHPSILDLLIKQEKVDLVMQPKDWTGSKEKRDDMIKLWQTLPKDVQKDYDIDKMLTTLNRLNLRAAAVNVRPSTAGVAKPRIG